jgi:hypothetical protein
MAAYGLVDFVDVLSCWFGFGDRVVDSSLLLVAGVAWPSAQQREVFAPTNRAFAHEDRRAGRRKKRRGSRKKRSRS